MFQHHVPSPSPSPRFPLCGRFTRSAALVGALALPLLAVLSPRAHGDGPPGYQIVPLDEVYDATTTDSVARAANEVGDIVGRITPNWQQTGEVPFPVRWTGPETVPLGQLSSWGGTSPWDINNAGEIVGHAINAPTCCTDWGVDHGFYYSPDTGFIDVTPDAETGGYLIRINESGVACGADGSGGESNGFIWSLADGKTYLDPDHVTFVQTYPQDINDHNVVVGNGIFVGDNALIWSERDGLDILPQGQLGVAFDLNNHNVVAGEAVVADLPFRHAAVWTPDGDTYERTIIPTSSGFHRSQAVGVNDCGFIIGGDTEYGPSGGTVSWLWRDGEKVFLTELLSEESRSEWSKLVAWGINEHGVILGIGQRPGEFSVAFAMYPQPASADLDDDGSVNVVDLLSLLAGWGNCDCCAADLTFDRKVDVQDLLELLGQWG